MPAESNVAAQVCDVCGSGCVPGPVSWVRKCSACGTQMADLRPTINETQAVTMPDEVGRVAGLQDTRKRGYDVVLAAAQAARGQRGGTLLEVGSAYGWFLEAAAPYFDRLIGIEPDDAVRTVPPGDAVEVREGYFPDAAGDLRVDVIAFNDVFEHIPSARRTAARVAESLNDGGVVAVSLPVSSGAMFRVASVLARFGLTGAYDRLWQKNFPSPHLYYFSPRGLRQVFTDAGLEPAGDLRLPTAQFRGLWHRVRHAEPSLPRAVIAYLGAVAMLPTLRVLPADVRCYLFRKPRWVSADS